MNQNYRNPMLRNPVSELGLPKTSLIHSDPAILAGKPYIRSTSLTVEFLKGLMASGWTRDTILDVYQYLTPQDMDAVRDLTLS